MKLYVESPTDPCWRSTKYSYQICFKYFSNVFKYVSNASLFLIVFSEWTWLSPRSGAISFQCRSDDERVLNYLKPLSHDDTFQASCKGKDRERDDHKAAKGLKRGEELGKHMKTYDKSMIIMMKWSRFKGILRIFTGNSRPVCDLRARLLGRAGRELQDAHRRSGEGCGWRAAVEGPGSVSGWAAHLSDGEVWESVPRLSKSSERGQRI